MNQTYDVYFKGEPKPMLVSAYALEITENAVLFKDTNLKVKMIAPLDAIRYIRRQ